MTMQRYDNLSKPPRKIILICGRFGRIDYFMYLCNRYDEEHPDFHISPSVALGNGRHKSEEQEVSWRQMLGLSPDTERQAGYPILPRTSGEMVVTQIS